MSDSQKQPRFVLLSRPDCHLCEVMQERLDAVLPLYDETYAVASVDSRSDWQAAYGEVIPVLLREGRPVAKTRVGEIELRRIVLGHRREEDAV